MLYQCSLLDPTYTHQEGLHGKRPHRTDGQVEDRGKHRYSGMSRAPESNPISPRWEDLGRTSIGKRGCVFARSFGHTRQHSGSELPNQGLNLCPLHWEHRFLFTHRTAIEVPGERDSKERKQKRPAGLEVKSCVALPLISPDQRRAQELPRPHQRVAGMPASHLASISFFCLLEHSQGFLQHTVGI